jgi:lipoprotein-anchoring transpeptidase ErfK/SrfK
MNYRKVSVLTLVGVAAVIAASLTLLSGARLVMAWRSRSAMAAASAQIGREKDAAAPEAKNAALRKKIEALRPRGLYIVIDTARNMLWLKKGEAVIRETVVSTGSGNVLKDPTGKKTWVFDTPRGEFSIKTKTRDPLWVKPDWAFYEEGEKLPTNWNDRVEEGTMGAFALGLGDGYFIHGTLYTRLLGRNVTHGCVRVGDKDLEEVFNQVPLGTKVYIF